MMRDRHMEAGVCSCTRCMLTSCGAIERSWSGWRGAELGGELRLLHDRVVRREPMIWPDVRYPRRWAGCYAWFDQPGLRLEWDDSDE
jgi:hypothetical protein